MRVRSGGDDDDGSAAFAPPRADSRSRRSAHASERRVGDARRVGARGGNARSAHEHRRAVGDVAETKKGALVFRPFERSVCVRARAAGGNERGHRRAGAPAASRAPRSRHAPAEAVHLLPPHEDHLHVHDLLRVRQVFVVEDRQVARAAGGVRVRPRRRERRHSDFRGLQNFVNRASGASGIEGRIRRVLRLAAQHREADARARAARLAGHGLHAELCAGRVRARVSGFGRRTPRARDDARRRGNEKEICGRGRTRAGVGAPLLRRAERPDVRQGPVQEYRLRGRGGADRSASGRLVGAWGRWKAPRDRERRRRGSAADAAAARREGGHARYA